jgi:RNA polymerase sigma factor (sigma-70 family)
MSAPSEINVSNALISGVQPVDVEKRLVNSLKLRDQQALSTLYVMYSSSLKGIIIRIVIHEETAEDLLQETFFKIWNSIDKYDSSKGRLFTWMSRLAKNLAIDQLRRKSHINSAKHIDIAEKIQDIDNNLNYKINTEVIGIRSLTTKMSPLQRLLLNMVYFEGYTHNEIAEELELPLGTVKSKIRFALLELRKMF